MHDNTLVAIAFCISALGIVGLLFALNFMKLPLTSIQDASQLDDNAIVKVQGTVEHLQQGNRTTITISEPITIDAVTDENITVQKGRCIIVQGKKTTYQERTQIIVTKILLCDHNK